MKNYKKVKEYLLITLGVLLVSVSIQFFLSPNNLAAGGTSGIAIIIKHFLPQIPLSIMLFMMDFILYIIAFIFLGNKFGGKTIYASASMYVILWIFDSVLKLNIAATKDLMLAAVFGTLISGLGMAIVFNQNASTGGTDIVAKILNKFFHVNIGKSLLAVDFLVTISAAITFGISKGLYALLAVIMSGFIIDYAIDGFNVCKQVIIITSKCDEISKFIIKDLDRSFTLLYGKGGYQDVERQIIYTILSRSEYINLKKFIREVDRKAFVAVNDSHEVLGEGFKDLVEE
ncbi:YitT family protein [Clostridium sp. 19966]|uniref:YitT family protein n=1 Tax=Clostridium sp. 19966 TaxID=2768166 RepID=UPI0028DECB7C|nr:YitT family protein [Clostridium sp. 19966]MDT8716105.1 YitT family protein [Clostridium sp. 19966]